MAYPATNSNDASKLLIDVSNQVHEVVNGTAEETVTTESGEIPTLRKAITDNYYFTQTNLPWNEGGNEAVFNQLREFSGKYYYAPLATASNPVSMGVTPIGDPSWKQLDIPLTDLVTDAYNSKVDAENTVNTAEALLSGNGYQGLWPDTGGSAEKGDTWQTQVGGVPTGEYYTALQNTSVNPVGDDVNWKRNGDINRDNLSDYTDIVYKTSGGNSAVENMLSDFSANPIMYAVGTIIKTGGTTWEYINSTGPITIENFRAFNVVNAADCGAVGDDSTLNTSAIDYAIQVAVISGVMKVYFPSGVYLTEGNQINDEGVSFEGEGQLSSIIKLVASSGAKALEFNDVGGSIKDLGIISSGDWDDGLNTSGIYKSGTSFRVLDIDNVNLEKFSLAAMWMPTILASSWTNGRIYRCAYGIYCFKNGAASVTTINLKNWYITNIKKQGVFFEFSASCVFENVVFEYCGVDGGENDCGLFLQSSNRHILNGMYYERNFRGFVISDCSPTMLEGYELANTEESEYRYSAQAFDGRGQSRLIGNSVKTRKLLNDDSGLFDLEIGSNSDISVSASEGKVNWYGEERRKYFVSGDLNTWNSVVTLEDLRIDGRVIPTESSWYRFTLVVGSNDATQIVDIGWIKTRPVAIVSDFGTDLSSIIRITGQEVEVYTDSAVGYGRNIYLRIDKHVLANGGSPYPD